MEVVRLSLEDAVERKEALALCIGYFDGLHIGHQALINSARDYAREHGIKCGLITFDPDPIKVIHPSSEDKKHLYMMEDRIALGAKMELDYWFILDFTKEMSQMDPKDFVQKILLPLNVKHLSCGSDFRFGFKGSGKPELLKQYNFEVNVLELVQYEDAKISSTRIIEALNQGEIEQVTQMLGRPYHLSGPVIGGNRQGQKIGFPTANLYVDDEYVLPKQGVYIGVAQVGNELYLVMINIGHNLTFNTRVHLSIEGNILDFNQVIYGEVITYHFLKFLRPELKFESVDDLVERMKLDELATRSYFEGKDLIEQVNMI